MYVLKSYEYIYPDNNTSYSYMPAVPVFFYETSNTVLESLYNFVLKCAICKVHDKLLQPNVLHVYSKLCKCNYGMQYYKIIINSK